MLKNFVKNFLVLSSLIKFYSKKYKKKIKDIKMIRKIILKIVRKILLLKKWAWRESNPLPRLWRPIYYQCTTDPYNSIRINSLLRFASSKNFLRKFFGIRTKCVTSIFLFLQFRL